MSIRHSMLICNGIVAQLPATAVPTTPWASTSAACFSFAVESVRTLLRTDSLRTGESAFA
jgi:hypothetical protein